MFEEVLTETTNKAFYEEHTSRIWPGERDVWWHLRSSWFMAFSRAPFHLTDMLEFPAAHDASSIYPAKLQFFGDAIA